MRLIDADALDDVMMRLNFEEHRGVTRGEYKLIDSVLFEFPTIEVQPERKTGKWKRRIVDSGYNADWICSECEYRVKTDFVNYNFCPNCGADMRKEEMSE